MRSPFKELWFLFALKALQSFAFTRGKVRIADPEVGNLFWKTDEDAIGSHIAKEALNFRVEKVQKLLGFISEMWV